MSSLLGQTIQLFFVNKCDYENNLYLDNINITSLTAIGEDELAKVSLYPNPTETSITLQGLDLNAISVYDLSGKLVCSNVNQNSIDVNALTNGLYIFKGITYSGQALIKKFEKK